MALCSSIPQLGRGRGMIKWPLQVGAWDKIEWCQLRWRSREELHLQLGIRNTIHVILSRFAEHSKWALVVGELRYIHPPDYSKEKKLNYRVISTFSSYCLIFGPNFINLIFSLAGVTFSTLRARHVDTPKRLRWFTSAWPRHPRRQWRRILNRIASIPAVCRFIFTMTSVHLLVGKYLIKLIIGAHFCRQVLVHGMWGNPGHLAELARQIRAKAVSEFHVLVAETNSESEFELWQWEIKCLTLRSDYTYDGADHGGERVADEVAFDPINKGQIWPFIYFQVIKEVETLREAGRKVTQFSITGYSLGGLVSRYAIGVLHQRKFFEEISPVNFNTFATPHLGLPRYPNFFSALATSLGPTFLSRTGEQFFALDKWSSTGSPLLAVMADPGETIHFMFFVSSSKIGQIVCFTKPWNYFPTWEFMQMRECHPITFK